MRGDHPPMTSANLTLTPADIELVRQRKLEHTSHLLGETIRLDESDWQSPSRLPGWTRAHVATHLARNADGFARVVEGLLDRDPHKMYLSEEDRRRDIERGSERRGLELQIDLDTSASHLSALLDRVGERGREAWESMVELRAGLRMPLWLLPLARLNEVVLHRIDLDTGFTVDDLEDETADWLVQWTTLVLGDRADLPRLLISTDSGIKTQVGSFGTPVEVRGRSADVVAWLTERGGSERLHGAEHVVLPLRHA